MKDIHIVIPGPPIAKKRPRFARRGKFVTTYSEQETEEGRTLLIALQQLKNQVSEPIQGPLSVNCLFELSRPKSHYRTGKNSGKIKESAPGAPTGKPDIDNMIKFYFDVLNGAAWRDDTQVVLLVAQKAYGEPKTTITIRTLTSDTI